MNLSELVEHQGNWQRERGMHLINGRWCADRISDEVDELKAEKDPLKALGECVDILIITFGGMYEAAQAAGIPLDELDKLIELKLKINNEKYPLEELDGRTAEDYITHCRVMWALRLARTEKTDASILTGS